MKAQIVSLVLCLGLGGCFPLRYSDNLEISGRVVDARTRAPVAGATVSFAKGYAVHEVATAVTDATGSFRIEERKSWSIYIPPMDFFDVPGQVTVRFPGYQTRLRNLQFFPVGAKPADLGDILLSSAAEGDDRPRVTPAGS